MHDGYRLFLNNTYQRDRPYAAAAQRVLSRVRLVDVEREIASWPGYCVTPLIELTGMADDLGLGSIHYKDEAPRFGLGSFKAIGGAYGVFRVLQTEVEARYGVRVAGADLFAGRHADRVSSITVTCATDGNHGRAVAWASELFGCHAVVYLPKHVSSGRAAAIEGHGATIVRVDGTYDDAVRRADLEAAECGRIVVSDQSYEGYESIPADIMQGYALSVAEVLAELPSDAPPTHVFVQAGVGGFAAAVCGHLWESLGPARPDLICVEPETADCVLRTAEAGRLTKVPGDLHTVMGCLSCGEASVLAWQILEHGARGYLTIGDERARDAMLLLSVGVGADRPLVAGESGAAGVGGLLALAADQAGWREVGLNEDSRVLLFGSEGATDPEIYRSIVGAFPNEVGGVTPG